VIGFLLSAVATRLARQKAPNGSGGGGRFTKFVIVLLGLPDFGWGPVGYSPCRFLSCNLDISTLNREHIHHK